MNPLRPHAAPLLSRLLLLSLSRGARSTTAPATAAAASTIGGARYASTKAAVPATAPGKAQAQEKQAEEGAGGRRPRGIPPPGHGERIWLFNHITDNLVLYSLTPELRSNKAFRQLIFTGKKLIPAKIRKDYWRPLAVVEFGPGLGDVGRSVFQKLRELKRRHLLEWDRETHADPPVVDVSAIGNNGEGTNGDGAGGAALLRMPRHERGKALNDQRGNSVADLAAVLGGLGKGNRIVVGSGRVRGRRGRAAASGKKEDGGQAAVAVKEAEEGKKKEEGGDGAKKVALHPATVYWANEQDKYYAQAWSDNVTHVVGLPKKGAEETPAAPVEGEAAPEAAQAEAA
ncbi:6d4c6e23-abda-4fd3-9c4d-7def7b2e7f12 [Thermothielavioides terrestris]|uniref:Large ribosomal subunit protein mL67 n=1 Tax=Thermothielavioides terrestris TaxID=2587410 RepID=A0A446BJU4_9PEZI|nr:6d4c6e23-abda-4fd3-9c4d-7def7b2e7f12 [Thermothielavioides terrestris]